MSSALRYTAQPNEFGYQVFDTTTATFCHGTWSMREAEATALARKLNVQYALWYVQTLSVVQSL